MQLARVLGEVVATMKDSNLEGMKLLVLQPLETIIDRRFAKRNGQEEAPEHDTDQSS